MQYGRKLLKVLQSNLSIVPVKCYSTNKVRVRFAPSPTGYLHLGGLRTALYNFFFARKHNGSFILRIEDTDQSRKVPGASEALQNDLHWAGIQIDEGPNVGGSYGPYLQSERLELYKEHVETLLRNGSAYRCFCTDRRLQLLKREAIKAQEVPKYDNRCRHLSEKEVQEKLNKDQSYCVRFRLSDQEQSFEDLIYGPISYNIGLLEGDPVILKSDGYPTYHLANVVDDYSMKISHVLRGVEWQISTTKHLSMYKAFGWEPPKYGHLPLLLNSDGTKLSKRQDDIRVHSYRENNIFPLALINYIANSGGGFEKDQERYLKPNCYTIEELCSQFDVSKINSHSGHLMEDKLLFQFNRLELKRQFQDEKLRLQLIDRIKDLAKQHLNITEYSPLLSNEYIEKILGWSLNRIDKLSDLFSTNLAFIWILPSSYRVDQSVSDVLPILRDELLALQEPKKDDLNDLLRRISKSSNIKYAIFMRNLRHILSGLKEGPSVAEMMEILGKDKTIERIDLCLNKIAIK